MSYSPNSLKGHYIKHYLNPRTRPFYFLGYGIPFVYVKKDDLFRLFLSG